MIVRYLFYMLRHTAVTVNPPNNHRTTPFNYGDSDVSSSEIAFNATAINIAMNSKLLDCSMEDHENPSENSS